MGKWSNRREAIQTIVRERKIATQRELVEELEKLGWSCTQATISRDISEMGLHKTDEGYYMLATDSHLRKMVSYLLVDVLHVANQVLVKTTPGTALGVAAAIDAVELPGVLGCVGGNDTVLAITTDDEKAREFAELLIRLSER